MEGQPAFREGGGRIEGSHPVAGISNQPQLPIKSPNSQMFQGWSSTRFSLKSSPVMLPFGSCSPASPFFGTPKPPSWAVNQKRIPSPARVRGAVIEGASHFRSHQQVTGIGRGILDEEVEELELQQMPPPRAGTMRQRGFVLGSSSHFPARV